MGESIAPLAGINTSQMECVPTPWHRMMTVGSTNSGIGGIGVSVAVDLAEMVFNHCS